MSNSLLMAHSDGPEQESEAERIASFKTALMELKMNSKPHIAMLSMLAESELNCPTAAEGIVRSIEQHLHEIRTSKASTQLELVNLYLIDSICKTVKGIYVELFTQNIVSNFVRIFERGDEKIRINLFKLRSTWNEIFPPEKLLALDRRIKEIDPKWPIDPHTLSVVEKLKQNANNEPKIVTNSRGVHINPLFIASGGNQLTDQVNRNAPRFQQLTKPIKQKDRGEKDSAKIRVESEQSKINQLINNQEANQFQMQERQFEAGNVGGPVGPTRGKRKRDKKRGKGRQELHSPPRKLVNQMVDPSQLMPPVPQPLPPQGPMAPQGPLYSRRPPMNQNPNFFPNGNNMVGPWIEPGGPFMPPEYPQHRPMTEWGDRDQRFPPGMPPPGPPDVPPSVMYPEQQLIRPNNFYQPVIAPTTSHSIQQQIGTPIVTLPPQTVVSSVPHMPIVPSAPQVAGGSSLTTTSGEDPFKTVNFNEILKVLTAGNSVIKNNPPGGPVPTSVVDANTSMTGPTQCSSGDQSSLISGPSDVTNLAGTSLPSTSSTEPNQPPHNQRNALPAEAKLEWTPESLKSFRPSLVAGLYDGRQCTSCPLRFLNQDGQYTQHLDWHFRQNKKKKLKSKGAHSLSRPWYYKFDLWLLFKEVCNEDDKSSKFFDSDPNSGDLDQQNSSKNEQIDTNTMVKAREDESENVCHVCSEKFRSLWHEEDEVWILKNAIERNGNIYHPTCLSDATASFDQTANASIELDSNEKEVSLTEIKTDDPNSESVQENICPESSKEQDNQEVQEPMQVDESVKVKVKEEEININIKEEESTEERSNEDFEMKEEEELPNSKLEEENNKVTGEKGDEKIKTEIETEIKSELIKAEEITENKSNNEDNNNEDEVMTKSEELLDSSIKVKTESVDESIKSEPTTENCDHHDECPSEKHEQDEASTSSNATTTSIITTTVFTTPTTTTSTTTVTNEPSPTPEEICVPEGPVVKSGKERSALCAVM